MNTTGLSPGYYLVGKDDQTIHEFFVRLDQHEVRHSVPADVILAALNDEGWTWRRMTIPHNSPSQAMLDALKSPEGNT